MAKKQKKESLIKSVKQEMKKVKWPTAKEILKYTFATLAFCLILAAFFMLLNVILSSIVSFIRGL